MDIEATRGDTNEYNTTVVRNNAVVNLAGGKAWFTLKRNPNDPDASHVLGINSVDNPTQVVLNSPTTGHINIILEPADTEDITESALYYDVQFKDSVGKIITVAEGIFRLTKDVTLSTA